MNVQTLIANLTLENEADRSDAAEDLGYAGASEAIAPLVARLIAEPSHKVRETIFLALERIESPEVLVQVAALFESDDAFLRNQAIGLLQRKGEAAVPILLAKMNDPDADVRKYVLDAAAGISLPAVDPIYEAAMRDEDINVVIAVLEHLGEHRMSRFKSAVEQIFLKATDSMLVCAAFDTLLQIGDTASWLCIRERYPTLASVPKWELGWWTRALGEFGSAEDLVLFYGILRLHRSNADRETIDALERFQERHSPFEITELFWATLKDILQSKVSPEDKPAMLRMVGGFSGPPAIGDYLVASLEQADRSTKLGAIEGIKRLGQPDLLALLRNRRALETDPEILEALGGC